MRQYLMFFVLCFYLAANGQINFIKINDTLFQIQPKTELEALAPNYYSAQEVEEILFQQTVNLKAQINQVEESLLNLLAMAEASEEAYKEVTKGKSFQDNLKEVIKGEITGLYQVRQLDNQGKDSSFVLTIINEKVIVGDDNKGTWVPRNSESIVINNSTWPKGLKLIKQYRRNTYLLIGRYEGVTYVFKKE